MSNNIISVHHVSFLISDLKIALEFYQDVLGLESDLSRPDLGYPGAWLTLPNHQQLHLMQLDNPDINRKQPAHGGRDRHVALSVKSISKIEKTLVQSSIDFTKSRSGRKAIFCRDPDGNALEFIEA